MSSAVVDPGVLECGKARERALLRILPSFSDIAFLFPMAALFLMLQGARTILGDSDTGWHIRTGDWIRQNGSVPRTDIFSFTKAGQSWFAWEWLWDVLFSCIHSAFGLSGIVLANALILSAVSVLLYRLVRRHAGNDARALMLTIAAVCATAIHWLARPHLVSWMLILITLHLIDRAEQGRAKMLWWMPLLTLLWANLHGSFPIAIFLLLAYGSVNAVQDLTYSGIHKFRLAIRGQQTYFLVAAASFAASFLNPYGWHLHEHVAKYLTDAKQLASISEFQSFDFHSSLAICLEFFLLAGSCAALRCFSRRQWAQGTVLLIWAHLSLKSARNLPIFVFLAAPAIAGLIRAALEQIERADIAGGLRSLCAGLRSFGKEFDHFERVERVPFVPIGAACLLAALVGVLPLGQKRIADFNANDFPVAAAKLLEKRPTARVFTFDQWGGYLIYRLYPKMQVFADGRSDFYGAEYGQDWVHALNGQFMWRNELARYSVNTVLVRVSDPLASVLKQTHDWISVFDDGRAIVFEKK